MGKTARALVHAVILCSLWSGAASAERGGGSNITLYQIGRRGNYCLSTTPDESGCVSGSDTNGVPINVMDIIRNHSVVFQNLSDAPHDMKFSGANAQDFPPQFPGAGDVAKKMTAEDMNKEKITCSFHGDQLGLGYRVPTIAQKGTPEAGGHKERAETLPGSEAAGRPELAAAGGGAGAAAGAAGAGGGGGGGGGAGGAGGEGGGGGGEVPASQPLIRTGLADVSGEVLAKGSPADVKKLIEGRPELGPKLKQVRPLLAGELASEGLNLSGGGTGVGGTAGGKGPAFIPGVNGPGTAAYAAASGLAGGNGRAGTANGGIGAGAAANAAGAAAGAKASLEKGLDALTVSLGGGKSTRLGGGAGHGTDGSGAGGGAGAAGAGSMEAGLGPNGAGRGGLLGLDRTRLKDVSLGSRGVSLPFGAPSDWLIAFLGLAAFFIARRFLGGKDEKEGSLSVAAVADPDEPSALAETEPHPSHSPKHSRRA